MNKASVVWLTFVDANSGEEWVYSFDYVEEVHCERAMGFLEGYALGNGLDMQDGWSKDGIERYELLDQADVVVWVVRLELE